MGLGKIGGIVTACEAVLSLVENEKLGRLARWVAGRVKAVFGFGRRNIAPVGESESAAAVRLALEHLARCRTCSRDLGVAEDDVASVERLKKGIDSQILLEDDVPS